jgi:hypothetical protein
MKCSSCGPAYAMRRLIFVLYFFSVPVLIFVTVRQFMPKKILKSRIFSRDLGGVGFSAFAEFVSVPEKVLALKPVSITYEEAATVPQYALVALQGLRDKGQIQAEAKSLD